MNLSSTPLSLSLLFLQESSLLFSMSHFVPPCRTQSKAESEGMVLVAVQRRAISVYVIYRYISTSVYDIYRYSVAAVRTQRVVSTDRHSFVVCQNAWTLLGVCVGWLFVRTPSRVPDGTPPGHGQELLLLSSPLELNSALCA